MWLEEVIKMIDKYFFHKQQYYFWDFDVIGNPYSIYEPLEITLKEKKIVI